MAPKRLTITGRIHSVNASAPTTFEFCIRSSDYPFGPVTVLDPQFSFKLSFHKALLIADSSRCFPLGVEIKVTGIVPEGSHHSHSYQRPHSKLTHVKVISVDNIELTAWSQRNRSAVVGGSVLDAAEVRVKEAEMIEAAMKDRAPPDNPNAITDPLEAYENAMRIVRRQNKQADPKLSKKDIFQLRDALNLLAEKLDIV
jgi:hypothetical protein